MSKTVVELKFDKADTRIAGFPYGHDVFISQVQDTYVMGEEILIIFPDNIQKVASSFIQGFFSEIIKEIGYAGFEKTVMIESSSENLSQYIINNVY